MALTLSMTAVMIPLACPIVRVAFERHAFGASESGFFSSLLICYISGEACAIRLSSRSDVFFHAFPRCWSSCAPIWREMEMISSFCSESGLFSSLA